MTKTRSSMKILACLMAVVAVLCSFAISASAMEPGAEYTPELEVKSTVPHELDFFDGSATVSSDGKTVTIPLKNPATVTVTIGGNSYKAVGYISSAVSASEGFTASVNDGHDLLTVTSDADLDVDEFTPSITFNVEVTDYEGGEVSHRAVTAVLHLLG